MLQEDLVTTLEVDPVLECSHGQEEQCHVTHVTRYEPSLEQVRGDDDDDDSDDGDDGAGVPGQLREELPDQLPARGEQGDSDQ